MIGHYTDSRVARAIVRQLPILPGQAVCDPHVGSGAFINALAVPWIVGDPGPKVERVAGLHVEAGDLWTEARGLLPRQDVIDAFASFRSYRGVDFLTTNPWRRPDWFIENPPYGNQKSHDEAEPHIRKSLEIVRPGGSVVALVQAGFLHGRGRYDRLWKPGSGFPRPYKIWNLVTRPPFETVNDPDRPPESQGGTGKYEYVAIWWNTSVPDARTQIDWLEWK